MRLPCIGRIAVIPTDVRDDRQLDEVERRAGGDEQVPGELRRETCSSVGAVITPRPSPASPYLAPVTETLHRAGLAGVGLFAVWLIRPGGVSWW
jgi:hypothetical protein